MKSSLGNGGAGGARIGNKKEEKLEVRGKREKKTNLMIHNVHIKSRHELRILIRQHRSQLLFLDRSELVRRSVEFENRHLEYLKKA